MCDCGRRKWAWVLSVILCWLRPGLSLSVDLVPSKCSSEGSPFTVIFWDDRRRQGCCDWKCAQKLCSVSSSKPVTIHNHQQLAQLSTVLRRCDLHSNNEDIWISDALRQRCNAEWEWSDGSGKIPKELLKTSDSSHSLCNGSTISNNNNYYYSGVRLNPVMQLTEHNPNDCLSGVVCSAFESTKQRRRRSLLSSDYPSTTVLPIATSQTTTTTTTTEDSSSGGTNGGSDSTANGSGDNGEESEHSSNNGGHFGLDKHVISGLFVGLVMAVVCLTLLVCVVCCFYQREHRRNGGSRGRRRVSSWGFHSLPEDRRIPLLMMARELLKEQERMEKESERNRMRDTNTNRRRTDGPRTGDDDDGYNHGDGDNHGHYRYDTTARIGSLSGLILESDPHRGDPEEQDDDEDTPGQGSMDIDLNEDDPDNRPAPPMIHQVYSSSSLYDSGPETEGRDSGARLSRKMMQVRQHKKSKSRVHWGSGSVVKVQVSRDSHESSVLTASDAALGSYVAPKMGEKSYTHDVGVLGGHGYQSSQSELYGPEAYGIDDANFLERTRSGSRRLGPPNLLGITPEYRGDAGHHRAVSSGYSLPPVGLRMDSAASSVIGPGAAKPSAAAVKPSKKLSKKRSSLKVVSPAKSVLKGIKESSEAEAAAEREDAPEKRKEKEMGIYKQMVESFLIDGDTETSKPGEA